MAGQIRFYTDENVPRAVIDGLRRLGVDVVSAPEMSMLERSDDEHLEFAEGLGRTLFTHDDDFLRLDSQGIPHAGIAYTHQYSSISRILNGLMRIHESKTPEDMAGHVEFI